MGKEADLLKAVKNNNKSKLQKLFLPEGDFRVRKADTPAGGIRLRLQHINVDCREPGTGNTPLILAILNGHKEIAESLIFHAAEVNATDSKGNTALHIAVFTDRNDMADMLLKNRAQVDLANSDGNTALHIACQSYASNNVLLILKLLQANTNPRLKNNLGLSPLDFAAMFNRKDAVSALLDHLPELRTNTRAIIEAAIRGHANIVEVLLDYGVDPSRLDDTAKTGALHEAIRFQRTDVADILLQFGASPQLVTGHVQSPEMIAKTLPKGRMETFLALIKDYAGKSPRKPRYFGQSSDVNGEIDQSKKDYPLLPNRSSWTHNSPKYCNSCTANNPNTNLLDDNACTFWVIPSHCHAWTALDLGHQHEVTGVKIWGWDSPQMVKTVELQKAESVEGPWSTICILTCQRCGSSSPSDPGVPQVFKTFTEQSRFWRILITENYGGNCICFQGLQFFGADSRISDCLKVFNLLNYLEDIITKGVNTYEKFVTMRQDELRALIPDDNKLVELMQELHKRRLTVYPITRLAWLQLPASSVVEDQILPAFSIQSDAQVVEDVQLVVRGCGVKGSLIQSLVPRGDKDPSVVAFTDIAFTSAGQVTLAARCARLPEVLVHCPHEITVRGKVKEASEIEAAFDDIEAMLNVARLSLDMPAEQEFSPPPINWQP